jgi:hypothetical protein
MAFDLGGIYPLDNQYQFIPKGFNSHFPVIIRIYAGQMERTLFQLHVVDNQSPAFHMQYFHRCAAFVDKNKGAPLPQIHAHPVADNPAQGIETFAHVTRIRV